MKRTIYNWSSLSPEERTEILKRPTAKARPELAARVSEILEEVRTSGDRALLQFTEKFDRAKLLQLEVTPEEWASADAVISETEKKAILRAKEQIERFHRAQVPQPLSIEVSRGIRCQRISRPVGRVGLYIPGGTAVLPSTVLMLGVPSALAGSPVRILCSPPSTNGTVSPYILFAARLCGIERVFKVGGAQAIAAMAYGTESIPKVDKIFGPGNAWVTEAKMQVSVEGVSIDMPAGPSEVLVIADDAANPDYLAADLLSQAEHGPDSQVVLISDSRTVLEKTDAAIARQLSNLPRRQIAETALESSRFILVDTLQTAFSVSNCYAPEHLIVNTVTAEVWVEHIQNAGSVFLGAYSPEAMGDYASGTNHVLPTYGWARTVSGISVDSFVKYLTVQTVTEEGLRDLGPTVEILAEIEGLAAHKRAISIRLERSKT